MNYPKFELGPLYIGGDHMKPVLQALVHTILFHRALGTVKPREISSDVFNNISYMTCNDDTLYKDIEEKIDNISNKIINATAAATTSSASSHDHGHNTSVLSLLDNNSNNDKNKGKSHNKSNNNNNNINNNISNNNNNNNSGDHNSNGNNNGIEEVVSIMVTFYESKQSNRFGFGQIFGASNETKQYWERWVIKLHLKSKKDIDLSKVEKNVKQSIIKIIQVTNTEFNHLPKLPTLKKNEKPSPMAWPFEITAPDHKDAGLYDKITTSFKKLVEAAPPTVMNT